MTALDAVLSHVARSAPAGRNPAFAAGAAAILPLVASMLDDCPLEVKRSAPYGDARAAYARLSNIAAANKSSL